jgi:formylglycine-generating enzyme required for sulfatase activity
MTVHDTLTLPRPRSAAAAASPQTDMVWVPGRIFQMGSDKHYPEESPVHRVTVDPFWIDRTPVTNREFRRSRRR